MNVDRDHLIADVHFEHRGNAELAPIRCTCGWTGLVGGWEDHRRSVGARIQVLSHGVGGDHSWRGGRAASVARQSAKRRAARAARRAAA